MLPDTAEQQTVMIGARIERQPRRLPAVDRRDWPREGGAGAEPGCLAAGAQQPRLASALGIVLAVWSADRRWRARVRAALFGWPKERIEVIDDDLGKSGTSTAGQVRQHQESTELQYRLVAYFSHLAAYSCQ